MNCSIWKSIKVFKYYSWCICYNTVWESSGPPLRTQAVPHCWLRAYERWRATNKRIYVCLFLLSSFLTGCVLLWNRLTVNSSHGQLVSFHFSLPMVQAWTSHVRFVTEMVTSKTSQQRKFPVIKW